MNKLVNLAKVNIKKRIRAANTITSKGDIKLNLTNEDISILDPNFTPQPIINNFEGYVVASSFFGINIGDKLDFDSNGRVINASSSSSVSIKAIALSSVHTFQLTDEEGKKDQEDYKLHLIKIALYGNKSVS